MIFKNLLIGGAALLCFNSAFGQIDFYYANLQESRDDLKGLSLEEVAAAVKEEQQARGVAESNDGIALWYTDPNNEIDAFLVDNFAGYESEYCRRFEESNAISEYIKLQRNLRNNKDSWQGYYETEDQLLTGWIVNQVSGMDDPYDRAYFPTKTDFPNVSRCMARWLLNGRNDLIYGLFPYGQGSTYAKLLEKLSALYTPPKRTIDASGNLVLKSAEVDPKKVEEVFRQSSLSIGELNTYTQGVVRAAERGGSASYPSINSRYSENLPMLLAMSFPNGLKVIENIWPLVKERMTAAAEFDATEYLAQQQWVKERQEEKERERLAAEKAKAEQEQQLAFALQQMKEGDYSNFDNCYQAANAADYVFGLNAAEVQPQSKYVVVGGNLEQADGDLFYIRNRSINVWYIIDADDVSRWDNRARLSIGAMMIALGKYEENMEIEMTDGSSVLAPIVSAECVDN